MFAFKRLFLALSHKQHFTRALLSITMLSLSTTYAATPEKPPLSPKRILQLLKMHSFTGWLMHQPKFPEKQEVEKKEEEQKPRAVPVREVDLSDLVSLQLANIGKVTDCSTPQETLFSTTLPDAYTLEAREDADGNISYTITDTMVYTPGGTSFQGKRTFSALELQSKNYGPKGIFSLLHQRYAQQRPPGTS